jgi:hypothetical protein
MVVKSFRERPWVVNNRRIEVLKSESSFVQYPMKGQWHQEQWSWGDCLCESCCNKVQLETQVAQLKAQLQEAKRPKQPEQQPNRQVHFNHAGAMTVNIESELANKAKLAQHEVNAIQYQEELSKAKTMNEKLKLKFIDEKEKRKRAEEDLKRIRSKIDNFREAINRSPTAKKETKPAKVSNPEQKGAKSIDLPEQMEQNQGSSSDTAESVMSPSQFKDFMSLQIHADEEELN